MTTILIVGKSAEIYVLHAKQNATQIVNKLKQETNTGLTALDDLLKMLDYFSSPQNWRCLENGSDMVVLYYNQTPENDDGHSPKSQPLSQRQHQVLQYLGEGLTTKQIASRMHLHPSTVAFHIRSLKKRLGTNTRAEFFVKATASGLFHPPPSAG